MFFSEDGVHSEMVQSRGWLACIILREFLCGLSWEIGSFSRLLPLVHFFPFFRPIHLLAFCVFLTCFLVHLQVRLSNSGVMVRNPNPFNTNAATGPYIYVIKWIQ
jgi:hypothetical protein